MAVITAVAVIIKILNNDIDELLIKTDTIDELLIKTHTYRCT